MIKAGKDNNFPEDYIGFLKSIETSKWNNIIYYVLFIYSDNCGKSFISG
jgi:hypothetical protein